LPARPPKTKGSPTAKPEGRVTGNVTDYEILIMLDPELPDERQEEIVKRTRDLVEKAGGTWAGQDVWGRRKLAYEIDKKTDGVYHLLSFSADGETLDEIARVLKIDDNVMRHLATRRYRPGSTQPVAVGGPGREDVPSTSEPIEEDE
jgi:small subunit ribosomal protein S6